MKTSLAIDPACAALLLVDLQEEHRGDPRYLVEGYTAVLANARKLLIAARAAHEISGGKYRHYFWAGSMGLGHLLPLVLLLLVGPLPGLAPVFLPVATLAAIIGLYLFEYAFVMAPQEIPNS